MDRKEALEKFQKEEAVPIIAAAKKQFFQKFIKNTERFQQRLIEGFERACELEEEGIEIAYISYSWLFTSVIDGSYQWYVQAQDMRGDLDRVERAITIDMSEFFEPFEKMQKQLEEKRILYANKLTKYDVEQIKRKTFDSCKYYLELGGLQAFRKIRQNQAYQRLKKASIFRVLLGEYKGTCQIIHITDMTVKKEELEKELFSIPKDEGSIRTDKDTISKDKSSIQTDKDTISKDEGSIRTDKDTISTDKSSIRTDKDTISKDEGSIRTDRDTIPKDKSSIRIDKDTISKDEGSIQTDGDSIPTDEVKDDEKEPESPFDMLYLSNRDYAEYSIFDKTIQMKALFYSSFWKAQIETSIFLFCNLIGADFSKARIKNSYFQVCTFQNASFEHAIVERTGFVGCHLSVGEYDEEKLQPGIYPVSFRNAVLHQVSFAYADISGCDFCGADISEVIFEQTKMTGSIWNKACIEHLNLTPEQRREIIVWEEQKRERGTR